MDDKPVNVRIPPDLRDRIDAARPSTTSREAWVRAACEAQLNAPEPPPTATQAYLASVGPKSPAARKPRPKGGK